jgi:hypothetical protein
MQVNNQEVTAAAMLAAVISPTLRRENPKITHAEILAKARKLLATKTDSAAVEAFRK